VKFNLQVTDARARKYAKYFPKESTNTPKNIRPFINNILQLGVNNCSSFLFKTQPVEFDHFVEVLFQLENGNKRESDLIPQSTDVYTPCIDLDANNIGFKDLKAPVNYIFRIVVSCVRKGIDVTVVVDGDKRHHSKRVSYARKGEREKSRLDSIEMEMKLTALRQENGNGEEATVLAKSIEKKRKIADRKLCSSFEDDLRSCISESLSDHVAIKKAQLQADPVLAKRNIEGLSEVIWSNDSDMIVHNPSCVLVHSCSVPLSGSPKNIILATGNTHMSNIISATLSKYPNYRAKPVFKIPSHLIFETKMTILSRLLVACAIGNNYWMGGQKGFGFANAMKIVKTIKERFFSGSESECVIQTIAQHEAPKNKGRGSEIRWTRTIEAYAQAFIFEPANEDKKPICYVHYFPKYLFGYEEAFNTKKSSCVSLKYPDGPLISSCLYLGRGHDFLTHEGYVTCKLCNGIICLHCKTSCTDGTTVCLACRRNTFGE
jgi:hypothetical protein